MSSRLKTGEKELDFLSQISRTTNRRQFFQWSGVGIAVTAAAACQDDRLLQPNGVGQQEHGNGNGAAITLGEGDIAVLNYAYTLEQLEADFFTQVRNNVDDGTLTGLSDREFLVLEDLRKHEVIHREFYAVALGDAAIPVLDFDFTSVDFSDSDEVLATSGALEDLGVSAYNGAAQLLVDPDFLLVAGKIVSNEARHASAVRDLIRARRGLSRQFFAGRMEAATVNGLSVEGFGEEGVLEENGLDLWRVPSQILPMANDFTVADIEDPEVLDSSGLPAPGFSPPGA